MKNGIYWFAFLSEKEQKEFRENCDVFYKYMDSEIESFEDFIDFAFDWIDTPQGTEYWSEMSNRDVQ